MESARPPVASAVGIRTEFEERVDEGHVLLPRDSNERGSAETEKRFVDRGPRVVAVCQHGAQFRHVTLMHRMLETFDRWQLIGGGGGVLQGS